MVSTEAFAADERDLLIRFRHVVKVYRIAETGVVGCNFEDQEVGGPGLHPIAEQARRVAAVVESGLWVNARTDLFLRRRLAGGNANDRALLPEALERAKAYAEAGAHSFFIPAVTDLALITEICAASPLPVNVFKTDALDIPALADAGVARISWGPQPWRWAMERLRSEAEALYRSGGGTIRRTPGSSASARSLAASDSRCSPRM